MQGAEPLAGTSEHTAKTSGKTNNIMRQITPDPGSDIQLSVHNPSSKYTKKLSLRPDVSINLSLEKSVSTSRLTQLVFIKSHPGMKQIDQVFSSILPPNVAGHFNKSTGSVDIELSQTQ